jgi:hypothetical protein
MTRAWRTALFAGILALHAALLLLAPTLRFTRLIGTEEPLQLLQLAPPIPASDSRRPAEAAARNRPRREPPPQSAAITVPSTPAPAGPLPPAAGAIDWSAEAALTARRLADPSTEPKPRSLDDHDRHQDGAGLREMSKPQFGWYYAGTHRFDTSGGLPVIHLSDRCVIPIGAMIPLPLCGIGKITARGDLFEHMRDVPDAKTDTPP